MNLQNRIECATPWTPWVSFQFPSQGRILIRGPSGCGKTTLLRAVAGLIPEARVRVRLGEVDYDRLRPEERRFGYLPQGAHLFPHLNVRDNVTFGLRVRGVGRKERAQLGDHWLEKVGLPGRGSDPVRILSGGEAKRVALARALIIRPMLLLLDEPFSALDEGLRTEVTRVTLDVINDARIPLLIASHDVRDLALCNQEILLGTKSIEDRVKQDDHETA